MHELIAHVRRIPAEAASRPHANAAVEHRMKTVSRRWAGAAFRRLRTGAADAGMTTVEYAMGMIAAVAFAGILLKVVTSGSVQSALNAVISRALK